MLDWKVLSSQLVTFFFSYNTSFSMLDLLHRSETHTLYYAFFCTHANLNHKNQIVLSFIHLEWKDALIASLFAVHINTETWVDLV